MKEITQSRKYANMLLLVFTASLAFSFSSFSQDYAKSITDFQFADITPSVVATIDETALTITAEVHATADLTTLVATFTNSATSTVKVGVVLQISGTTVNDFTNPVTYTVTALDNSVKNYVVTVTKAAARTANSILTFAFNGISPAVDGFISELDSTIVAVVHNSTDITNLVATFTNSLLSIVSVGGVNQVSETSIVDFTNPVTYLVTAESGATKEYEVTVTKSPARDDKELLSFQFDNLEVAAVGVFDGFNVAVTVPSSTDVTTLVASFTNSDLSSVRIGATVQTSGTTPNNFTTTVTYTVWAENGSSRNYYITVTKADPVTGKELTSFEFLGLIPPVTGAIDQAAHTVAVTVPHSTNVTALVASFTRSTLATVKVGGIVQQSGTTPQNFTAVVTYTVEAENTSTQNYFVTVTKAPAKTEKVISTFSFLGLNPPVNGVISESTNAIAVTVPFLTNVTALVATFSNSFHSNVSVGGVPQVSGTTANDFTNAVSYLVTAEDLSTRYYTVTVTKETASTANTMLSFAFNGLNPVINCIINEANHTITCSVLHATDITALVATFTHSPYSTVSVGGLVQVSGITPNDFTGGLTYTVTAQDATTQDYQVAVNHLPASQENSLLSFSFQDLNPVVVGVINEVNHTVNLTVPNSTNLATLIATFTNSPLSNVSVGGVNQVSGTTVNDFSAPVNYSVTAEDASIEIYIVTVTKAAISTDKAIETYTFSAISPAATGLINETAGTITVKVNLTIDITNLVATFLKSGGAVITIGGVVQVSGTTVNDFTNPVTYLVTAEDASTKEYIVTVTKADLIPPVVTADAQSITNAVGAFAIVQTNEASGSVYLLRDGEPADSIVHFQRAVAANKAVTAFVGAANVDIPLATANLVQGNYYAYASDAAGNISARGANIILVTDLIPPVVTAAEQTASNTVLDYFEVSSNENNGKVYVIMDGEPQSTVNEFDIAVATNKGASVVITKADSLHQVVTLNLLAGIYYAYAVDSSGNISVKGINTLTIYIQSSEKEITAFRFAGLNPEIVGAIAQNNILLAVAMGTDITALVATFVHSANSVVTVNDVVQVSGVTANDFTFPVTYKVTAENASFTEYTVTVTIGNSIEELTAGEAIKIYPVPVADVLYLENLITVKRIILTNTIGQTIRLIENNGDYSLKISTSSFNNGIYFLRFYSNEGLIRTQKIIVR